MPLLGFTHTRSLLAKYGITMVKSAYSPHAGKVVAEAKASIKPPFVLKAVGPGIKHKTERGLVNVGIHTISELEHSINKMSREMQGEKDAGFLVQEMLRGAELIVGAKRDAAFGPTVLFGTGGIYAELLDDVAVRPAPLSEGDCREMISRTKASKFMTGFRSMKADEKKVIELLMKTAKLIENEKNVVELDFNPVIATSEGVTIVDARVVVE